MFIFSKNDYIKIIEGLKKSGIEVNGTYEHIAASIKLTCDTKRIKEIFSISDEFEREFVEAITHFKEKKIGPYITEKYFGLIPALKESMRQLVDDCVETRRCVIQFPPEHCFQSMQFILRENTVNVVCYMRSCDAVKNLPHDIWICSKMADIYSSYLESMLKIHPYAERKISISFGSLHVYKEDVKDVF
jgi:hypothetical protein